MAESESDRAVFRKRGCRLSAAAPRLALCLAARAARSLRGIGLRPMATQTEIATADELEEKKDAVSLDAPPKEPALVADPRYLQMNPAFPGLAQLHTAPPLYRVRGFLSPDECDRLINSAKDHMTPAPVVGAGNGQVSTSRTSSTCYLAREDLPSLVSRVCALTGKPLEHLELPQVGRYMPDQFYRAHYDAFDLSTPDGKRFSQNGGQRVGTVLVYLNDVAEGGHTSFAKLGLSVQPVKGDAIVFFPATLEGKLDDQYLHAAEPAVDIKWVSQIWIRQTAYNGRASTRLKVQL